jgi:hypothetical protein
MYKVKDGKEGANVNGVILGEATQPQLAKIFKLGHPYILKTSDDVKEETTTEERTIEKPSTKKRKKS